MDGLDGHELCTRLQIDAKQLTSWVREGLPFGKRGRKRVFDPAAVREWLIQTGKAEPVPEPRYPNDQPIAHTIPQVAEHFNVSERTVARWINDGMPGRPGRPGTQEGWFPLDDIAAWKDGRSAARLVTGDETKNQAQARVASARAAMLELELAEKQGRLIDAEEVARRWVRLTHEARAQLAQLPTRIAKSLPNDVDPATRKKARVATKRAVDRVLTVLAVFLESEAVDVESQSPEGTDGPSDS